MALRACMDHPLLLNGISRVAGVANRTQKNQDYRPLPVLRAACPKRPMVLAVLWLENDAARLHRDRDPVAAHPRHSRAVLQSSLECRLDAGALPPLGRIRIGTELYALANEFLSLGALFLAKCVDTA